MRNATVKTLNSVVLPLLQSVVREEKQQQQALVRLTFWNVNSAVEQKQFASCDDPEAVSSICKEGDFDMFKTHKALELSL